MAKNNSANVSAAKPQVGGAIFWAPAETALPTDASTELDAAFECVGYVSTEGVTEKETRSYEKHAAWGGDTVASAQTEYVKVYSFKMIETNATTMKIRYGAANVTVGEDGKVTQVKHNAKELPEGRWVIEMIIAGRILRKVMPRGKMEEVGDITYNHSDLVSYDASIGLLPDENGDYETDYYAEVA